MAEQIVRFRMNVNNKNDALKKLLHEPYVEGKYCPIELEMTCFHCSVCDTYTEFSEIPDEVALTCENVLNWHRKHTSNSLCNNSYELRQMNLVFFSCECENLNGIKIPVSSKPYENILPPAKCQCGICYSAHIQNTPKGSVEVSVISFSGDGEKVGCVATKEIITDGRDIHRATFWTSDCPVCHERGRSEIINYYNGEAGCIRCNKKCIMKYDRKKEIFEVKCLPKLV